MALAAFLGILVIMGVAIALLRGGLLAVGLWRRWRWIPGHGTVIGVEQVTDSDTGNVTETWHVVRQDAQGQRVEGFITGMAPQEQTPPFQTPLLAHPRRPEKISFLPSSRTYWENLLYLVGGIVVAVVAQHYLGIHEARIL